MAYEFCTLFDANYLPRGLALYRSLAESCPDFRLRAFCMDRRTEDVLRALDLPKLSVVSLPELEGHDSALASVKADRTPVEYCWTATPAICLFAFETEPELGEITYLDADLMFFADPEPLFEELGSDSILIVPHRYAPEHRGKEEASGIYNVEWLTFKRDERGLTALRWWHERCIEWCYARVENGKMGDQKYLDDWPERFEGVHVLRHPGGGLAPWNVTNHELRQVAGRMEVDGVPLVFYHHHGLDLYEPTPVARLAVALRILRSGPGQLGTFWSTDYPASKAETDPIWTPYLRSIDEQISVVRGVDPGLCGGLGRWRTRDTMRALEERARRLARVTLHRLKALHPARIAPGRFTRHRDSWRSAAVAEQMLALTDSELRDPEQVPPYRAFLELASTLESDPELRRPARFLDIGCGMGGYGEVLERWAPDRFEYVGADYSPQILALARARWPGRQFVERDLFAPGALDGFDVVLGSAVVDVQADFERALRSLCAADARWLLLHRQQITDDRSRAEVAPGYQGQWTYRSYLRRDDLDRIAAEYDRRVVASAHVSGDMCSFLLLREEADDRS